MEHKSEMNSTLARDANWYAKLPKLKLADKALWSTTHCLLHQRRPDGSAPVVLETDAGAFYRLPPLYDAIFELSLRHTHKSGSLPQTAMTLQGLVQQQVLAALNMPGRYVPRADGSVEKLHPATDAEEPVDPTSAHELESRHSLESDGASLPGNTAGGPLADSAQELGAELWELIEPNAPGGSHDIGSADAAEHPRGPEVEHACNDEPAQLHKCGDMGLPQAALDTPMMNDTAEQTREPDADNSVSTQLPNTNACSCQSPIPAPMTPTTTSVEPLAQSESSAMESTAHQEATPRADGAALILGNVDTACSAQIKQRKSKRKDKKRRKHR